MMDEREGLAEASSITTIADAEAQHPGLDASKPAASEEKPAPGEVVLAQTAEEVEAQYVNRAGGPEPTQEGDANADDEDNAAESDSGITPDEAADLTDPEPERPAAPAPDADASPSPAPEPALDVSDPDTADGGAVIGDQS